MNPSDCLVRETPPWWADLCADEFVEGSIEEKEVQEQPPNAIALLRKL